MSVYMVFNTCTKLIMKVNLHVQGYPYWHTIVTDYYFNKIKNSNQKYDSLESQQYTFFSELSL